jgi:hypothetical protein
MRSSWRAVAASAGLTAVLLTGACKPENSNDNDFISNPGGPSQANVVVTASNVGVSTSPRPGFNYRITIPVTIRETAGLGANMDAMRFQLYANGRSVETQEIGANDIIAVSGSNRLTAGSTKSFTLFFDMNAGQATSGLLTLLFTDDRGNRLSADFTVAF